MIKARPHVQDHILSGFKSGWFVLTKKTDRFNICQARYYQPSIGFEPTTSSLPWMRSTD